MKWWNKAWNPVSGCSFCSEGCENCYAANLIKKRIKSEKNITFDVHVNKKQFYKNLGDEEEFIFITSQGDLFHHQINEEIIDDIFKHANKFKNKKYAVLTKRSSYMKEYFLNYDLLENIGGMNFDNFIVGVTVENNKRKYRIDNLIECGNIIPNKFISLEPCLEDIDIKDYLKTGLINWVVVGCESGDFYRDCKIQWIENIVTDCKEFNVPVFVNNINIDGKVTDNICSIPSVYFREFYKDFYVR